MERSSIWFSAFLLGCALTLPPGVSTISQAAANADQANNAAGAAANGGTPAKPGASAGQKEYMSPDRRAAIRGVKYVKGEVLVRFTEDALAPYHKVIPSQALDALIEKGPVKLRKLIRRKGVDPKSKVGRWQVVTLPGNVTVEEALELFKNDPNVEAAEPNAIITVNQLPNDPSYSSLWGMTKISAPQAWDSETGDVNIVVAVIDTGVDYTHPDLAANMWTNPGEIPNNGVDDDGNGYVDDIYGYDFSAYDSDPMDEHNHGTHVAGTIGAVGNNGVGVAGVNWTTRIMAVRFLDNRGSGTTSGAVEAFDYAIASGANITNNSWGGAGQSLALNDVINKAGAAGILSVAAAGNNGQDLATYDYSPGGSQLDSLVSVAATDAADSLASFSNWGVAHVHLAAPGVGIYSTIRGGGYGISSGTSMATPHVAGAAALVWAANPSLSVTDLKNLLMNTADPVAELAGKTVSGGRLNLAAALGATLAPNDFKVSYTPTFIELNSGDTVTTTATIVAGSAYSDTLNLSVSGANPALTPTLADASLAVTAGGSASTTLTVATTANLPQGYYPITVTATDGMGVSHQRDFTIKVNGPYLSISPSINKQLISPGQSVQYTLTLTSMNGYSGQVTLDTGSIYPAGPGLMGQVGTVPEGMVISYDTPTLTFTAGDSYTVVMTVTTTALTPAGYNYNIAISAQDQYKTWTPGVVLGVWKDGMDLVNVEAWADETIQYNLDEYYPFYLIERNQGVTDAPAHSSSIYLSTDTIIDQNDVLIATVNIPAISGGGGYHELYQAFHIPPTMATGSYYVGSLVDVNNQAAESDETNNISPVLSLINVVNEIDYAMNAFSISAASPLFPGDLLPLSATVTNLGTLGGSKDVKLGYYLSQDSVINNQDKLLSELTFLYVPPVVFGGNIPIPPGAVITDSREITLDSQYLQSGRYYVGAIIDSGEVQVEPSESNNSVAATPFDLFVNADIVPTSMTADKTQAAAGESVTLTFSVANNGSTMVNNISVNLYLSSDSNITAADSQLGSVTIAKILPGETVALTQSVTAAGAQGRYYLGLIADTNNVIAEVNENNNSIAGDILEISYKNDPAVTAVSYSKDYIQPGDLIDVNYTLTNFGEATVTGSNDPLCKVYLSVDAVIDPTTDVYRGSCNMGVIAPGGSLTLSYTTSVLSSTVAGDYYLGVQLSGGSDTNTINNTLAGPVLKVGANVDLAVSSISTNLATYTAGDSADISITVTNPGTDSISAGIVTLYLSADGTYSAGDLYLGEIAFSNLSGGESRVLTQTVPLAVAQKFAAGSYYVVAVADVAGRVSELDEANNSLASSAVTLANNIDLVVDSITTDVPGSIGRQAPLNVTMTIKNIGTSAVAPGYKVGLYSKEGMDSTVFHGNWTTTQTLAPGATETYTMQIEIPYTDGPYYNSYRGPCIYDAILTATVDQTTQVAELDETNNSLTYTQSAFHDFDLVPVEVTASKNSVVTGDIITLTGAITNLGPTSLYGSNYHLSEYDHRYYVGIYISTDANVTTADTLLTSWVPGGNNYLDQNEIDSKTVQFSISSSIPTGDYYLGIIADVGGVRAETDETNNVMVSPIPFRVNTSGSVTDLRAVFSAADSSSVIKGGSLTVESSVQNAGDVAVAAGVNVGVYLSTDNIINATDTLLGTWQTTQNLVNRDVETNSLLVTVPASLAGGQYYVGTIVDNDNVISEYEEGNNSVAGTLITVINDSDLVINAVTSTTSSLAAGESLIVASTIQNNGTDSVAAGLKVGLYLSQDSVVDATDVYLGEWTTTLLLGNGIVESQEITVTVPADLAAGGYYLGAVADGAQAVLETNETNNSTAGGLVSVSQSIDLVINTVSVLESNGKRGGSITVDSTIQNSGPSQAPMGSSVGIYLSADAVIDGTDTLLGYWQTGSALASGQSESRQLVVPIAQSVVAGAYYVGALADYAGTVTETDETNNGAGLPFTIVDDFDLTMAAISTTATTVTSGNSISVDSSVQNIGLTTVAAGVEVAVYLSTDTVIDGSDTLIGSWNTVNALVTGQAEINSSSFTVPVSLPSGAYYLGAIADNQNIVAESNELNNTLSDGQLSVQNDVDLIIQSVTSSASSMYIGDTVTVTSVVQNTGSQLVVAGHEVKLYLSSDTVIDATDTFLGSWVSTLDLAGGASESQAVQVTIPYAVAGGTYYIGAVADANGLVNELVETNNTAASAGVTVVNTADLAISAVSVPVSSLGAGQGVTVSGSIQNNSLDTNVGAGVQVGVYLSTDAVIDGTDTLLGTWATSQLLAAGGSENINVTVWMPITGNGNYYVGLIADYDQVISETNESNNTMATTGVVSLTPPTVPVADIEVCKLGCPYNSIQDAVNAAPNGGVVDIYDGVYNESITLERGVAIKGVNGAASSILDASGLNSRAVLIYKCGSIYDMTITGGNAATGAGVYYDYLSCSYASRIMNSIIRDNVATSQGGGIYSEYMTLRIDNTLLKNNTASTGGGIWGQAQVYDSTFDSNTGSVAGMYLYANVLSDRNKFFNNNGVALQTNSSYDIYIKNSLFVGNTTAIGHNNFYSNAYIINCTIADNQNGISSPRGDTQIINSILWNNTTDYPSVQGSALYSITTLSGVGNVNADPMFVGNGDYHVTAGSPAIDAGKNTYDSYIIKRIADDLDKVVRPVDGDGAGAGTTGDGSDYDIGAYEYVAP